MRLTWWRGHFQPDIESKYFLKLANLRRPEVLDKPYFNPAPGRISDFEPPKLARPREY